MSFREMRRFIEQMRMLGYPRLISVESFRRPNFPLVADILSWLVKSFDPDVSIPADVATEAARVAFIRAVAQFMATTAGIQLDLKHLYQADGYAVREMLKITSQLSAASIDEHKTPQGRVQLGDSGFKFNCASWMTDLKAARQLASEVMASGASLCSSLKDEVSHRKKRAAAITKPLDISETEKALQDAIKEVLASEETTAALLHRIESDVANLDAKIEKKMKEVEWTQTKLQTCQSIRPVYMDEYEEIEGELETAHEDYVLKFRCLTHLDSLMDRIHQGEREKLEEAENAKRMVASDRMWASGDDGDFDSETSEDEGSHEEKHRLDREIFIRNLLSNKRFQIDDEAEKYEAEEDEDEDEEDEDEEEDKVEEDEEEEHEEKKEVPLARPFRTLTISRACCVTNDDF